MSKRKTVRYWGDAREKVEDEGRCRVCRTSGVHIEAAHTVNRKSQDQPLDDVAFYMQGRKAEILIEMADQHQISLSEADETLNILYVNPDSIIPLCKTSHTLYDAHKLSLLEYMSHEEQANAVRVVGIVRALRITGLSEIA